MRWAVALVVVGFAAAFVPVSFGWSDLPDAVPLGLAGAGAVAAFFVWRKRKTVMRFVAALACALLAVALGVWMLGLSSYGAVEGTPAVGSRAPDIRPIRVRDGAPFHLTAQRKDDVLLVFFRGAWWPYCVRELGELAERFEILQRLGVRVYALSHDPVDALKELQDEMGDAVTLLSDPEGDAIAKFGMLDENAFPEKKLARAGVFHIDRKGMVRHVWLTDSYRRRPNPDRIVERIKG